MLGGIIALIVMASVSLLIVRIGAVALERTGLSRDAARFQSLSAFFGVGFTTSEAEMVVDHPVRRRIIRDLMIVGQIGVLTFATTAMVSFVRANFDDRWELVRLVLLLMTGLFALWVLSRSRVFLAIVDRSIAATLQRTGMVRALDYERLLHVRAGYSISEVTVEENEWMDGRRLSMLEGESILVLGVARSSGRFIGAPGGGTVIHAGDTLVVYGSDKAVKSLAGRAAGEAGDQSHDRAVAEARSESVEHSRDDG